ncbi:MAG: 1,4-alpha-glucan branching protein GlgB, partial [Chlamydiae bacterium]|nr:1,4-alpha-glucan branching protein GlgB [Chlamydiota bacterium]
MDIACFSYDPHRILGLHPLPDGQLVLRIFRPDAEEAFVRIEGKDYKLLPCKENGFFALTCPPSVVPKGYQIYYPNGLLTYDPYGFTPTWGELDSYLFSQGTHYKLYEVLGARVSLHQGVRGVKFAVWAPSASMVAVMGDFSHWDTRVFPMRCLGRSGVWELFLPGLQEGEKYKFCITTASGDILYKMDPMGYSNELRPATASIVFDVDTYPWQDQAWIQDREKRSLEKHPVAVYEVHLGSWKQELRNYQEIAKALACYVKEMGFTHVELLPIAEHPLDESWGYQVTGFYAVTSRFGTPRDFQAFVDILHAHGIGVILDWVPGHFPDDSFALARFDGTCLYEHEDPRQGHHPHWHTKIFNYGRHEVSAFLLANALFWLDKMHVDGLRVDAVASMLYLDYGRSEGEWIPNAYGGKENIEAIAFLKHLNAIVHERFPGVWMIAEESTSFIGVTHSLAVGGLGFDRKWNMGWMNDTLRYFSTDPFFRGYDHEALTFGLLYAFSEKFHLVLSHDEVVHGKRSLLAKMPGPDWQKFAGMRLLYSYMICQLGKKLLFMGGEIGQWSEWNCKEELDWFLLQYPLHQGLQACIRDLNHLYRQESALWQDDNPPCFSWVDFSDRQNSIISYLRKDDNLVLFCVHNFTPTYFPSY